MDRNLITWQAEVLDIRFAAFLSLQIVGYYVYYIVMNSWLDEHWRLVKTLVNPNIHETVTSVLALPVPFCLLL